MKNPECECGLKVGDLVTVPNGARVNFGGGIVRTEIEPHDVCTIGDSFFDGRTHVVALYSPHIRHHEIACCYVARARPVIMTLALDSHHASALYDAIQSWTESEASSPFEWRHDAAHALNRALRHAMGASAEEWERHTKTRVHHNGLWDAPKNYVSE